MNLAELEQRAREARKDGDWFPSDFGFGAILREDAAYIAACSPDVILRLVAIAKAAEKVVAADDKLQNTPVGEFTGEEVPACDAAVAALRAALSPLTEKEKE